MPRVCLRQAVCFAPGGRELASVSEDGMALLHDVRSGAELAAHAAGLGMRAAAFVGDTLFVGRSDGRLQAVDTASKR